MSCHVSEGLPVLESVHYKLSTLERTVWGIYVCFLWNVLSVNQMPHWNGSLVSDTPFSLFVVFLYRTTKSVDEISAMLIALLDNLLCSWIA